MSPKNNHLPLVIAISGPPRAGKDTTASILFKMLADSKIAVHRMSAPLKSIATSLLFEKKFAVDSLKDTPINSLSGVTFRQLQIDMYHYGAQKFGLDWLGYHFLQVIHHSRWLDFILMPDAGRESEIRVLLDHEVPLLHIQLERPGTTYQGDSRSPFMLDPTSVKFPTARILNDLTPEHLQEVLRDWLESVQLLPPS